MLSDEQIAAIQARTEAATPGPWVVFAGDDFEVMDTIEPAGTGMVWKPDWTDQDPEIAEMYPFERHQADAIFISHAREDIPALLTERAALRAALANVLLHFEAVIDQDEWTGATDAVDAARALLAGEGEDTQP